MVKWLDRIFGSTKADPHTVAVVNAANVERTEGGELSFEEKVVAAQFAWKQAHGYYMPIREESNNQSAAWEALRVIPPVGEFNWIRVYSSEHGQGYELIRRKVGQYNAVVTRVLHVGSDPTKNTREEGWF